MRVIHLCFQLHEPWSLRKFTPEASEKGYFDSKADFAQADAEIYQPLFAFLERTTQKYTAFRFSLLVSGLWLELAEKYDATLIERLQKLVKLGQVELVAEPYYHSLAFFYDKAELTEQVQLYREKIQKLFGVEGRIFALPELIYNDQVGKWAEDFGFAGMLVGGSPRALSWRSPNHVYEAMECRYLRLLFRNTPLSLAIANANPELLSEKKIAEDADEKKLVLSAQKFQKRLELDMLRGKLVNLYFDADIFQKQRSKGVIGFFDDLVTNWLKVQGNYFVGAAQACVAETPNLAISVKESVSWHPDEEGDETDVEAGESGLVLMSEVEARPPCWLQANWQQARAKKLYALRREILASEEEHLIADWRRLGVLDYLLDEQHPTVEDWQAILDDLKQRAEAAKKTQAVEISRAYTKKRDRGNIDVWPVADNTVIKVNFGSQRGGTASQTVHAAERRSEDEVPVRRLRQLGIEEAIAQPVAVVDDTVQVNVKPKEKAKAHGIRKVIRRLVIE